MLVNVLWLIQRREAHASQGLGESWSESACDEHLYSRFANGHMVSGGWQAYRSEGKAKYQAVLCFAMKSGECSRLGRIIRAGTNITNSKTYRFARRTVAKYLVPSGRELSRQIAHSSQTGVIVTLGNRARKIAASLMVQ